MPAMGVAEEEVMMVVKVMVDAVEGTDVCGDGWMAMASGSRRAVGICREAEGAWGRYCSLL